MKRRWMYVALAFVLMGCQAQNQEESAAQSEVSTLEQSAMGTSESASSEKESSEENADMTSSAPEEKKQSEGTDSSSAVQADATSSATGLSTYELEDGSVRYEFLRPTPYRNWKSFGWIQVKEDQIVDGYFGYTDMNGKAEDLVSSGIQDLLAQRGVDAQALLQQFQEYLVSHKDVSDIPWEEKAGATQLFVDFKRAAVALYKGAGFLHD